MSDPATPVAPPQYVTLPRPTVDQLPRGERLAKRVMLIGWDGADWGFLNPLIDEGKMPHLAGMIERGVVGNIASLQPMLSPMLWNSIATGKRADRHGILGFLEPTPDGTGVRPVSSTSRRAKAFWNIGSQAGLRSIVVNWYASHPAEPFDGACVTNLYPKPKGGLEDPWPLAERSVHPESVIKELTPLRVHPQEFQGNDLAPFLRDYENIDPENKPQQRQLLGQLQYLVADGTTCHAAFTQLIEHQDWDISAIYLETIDRLCHDFIHFHPPHREGVPKPLYDVFCEVLNTSYIWHDMMLGRLLELGGEDTLYIIISDHGFKNDHRRPPWGREVGPVGWHNLHGTLIAAGPGIKPDERVYGASLLDVAPTILTALGLPVGADMDGKVLVDMWETPPEVQWVPSWEIVDGGNDGMHDEEARNDPFADAEAVKQLQDLGYVEDTGDDEASRIAMVVREAQNVLAGVHLDAGRVSVACAIYEELVEDPESGRNYLGPLINCYLNLGRIDDARERVEQLRDLAAGDEAVAQLMVFDGLLACERGDHERGIEFLKEAYEIDPQGVDLRGSLGRIYLELGQWAEAERYFQRALERDDRDPNAMRGLAICALRMRRPNEAVDLALEAVGMRHFDPLAHLVLGQALMLLKWWDRARRALEVCLKLAPTYPLAHRCLARCLYNLGEREAAKKHAHLARSLRTQQEELPAPRRAYPMPGINVPEALSDGSAPIPAGPFVAVVSGLPRSGTSLLMQMLAAGGLPAITDHIRVADADNPKGYWEDERVKKLRGDTSWLADSVGHSLKVIHHHLYDLPPGQIYRVVFLERNLEEVLASQRKMLERSGRPGSTLDDEKLARVYTQQAEKALRWLDSQPHCGVLVVSYNDIIADPLPVARRIAAFFGEGDAGVTLDVDAMCAVVDPSLYRQRKQETDSE